MVRLTFFPAYHPSRKASGCGFDLSLCASKVRSRFNRHTGFVRALSGQTKAQLEEPLFRIQNSKKRLLNSSVSVELASLGLVFAAFVFVFFVLFTSEDLK